MMKGGEWHVPSWTQFQLKQDDELLMWRWNLWMLARTK